MRVTVVRGFAGYLHTIDPAHEIIPPGLIAVHVGRAVPYLYSDNDIATLMAEAERLDRPLRRATIATVIGLLAVTGMRIGEVIGLDDTDFDPDQQLFTVRHAKLGKHRLLPLHPSTVDAVNGYRRRRDSVFAHPVSTALLVSGAGTRLLHCNVGQTIAKLARSAGLAARSPGCPPPPHQVLHSLGFNPVVECWRVGGAAAARFPSLSTYLGHVAPANTYWYLQAAPELLTEAAHRLEAHPAEGGDRR